MLNYPKEKIICLYKGPQEYFPNKYVIIIDKLEKVWLMLPTINIQLASNVRFLFYVWREF